MKMTLGLSRNTQNYNYELGRAKMKTVTLKSNLKYMFCGSEQSMEGRLSNCDDFYLFFRVFYSNIFLRNLVKPVIMKFLEHFFFF